MSMCEQNLDRQLDAFSTFGVDGLFADRASGKDFERPEWLRPTAALRAGDVLVVKSIDRWAAATRRPSRVARHHQGDQSRRGRPRHAIS